MNGVVYVPFLLLHSEHCYLPCHASVTVKNQFDKYTITGTGHVVRTLRSANHGFVHLCPDGYSAGVVIRKPGSVREFDTQQPASPTPLTAWSPPKPNEVSSFAPSQDELDDLAMRTAIAETSFSAQQASFMSLPSGPDLDDALSAQMNATNMTDHTNMTIMTDLPEYDAQNESYIEVHGYPGEQKHQSTPQPQSMRTINFGANAAGANDETDALRAVLNFHAIRGTDPLNIAGQQGGDNERKALRVSTSFLHNMNAGQELVETRVSSGGLEPIGTSPLSGQGFQGEAALPDQSTMNTMNPLFDQQAELQQEGMSPAFGTLNTPGASAVPDQYNGFESEDRNAPETDVFNGFAGQNNEFVKNSAVGLDRHVSRHSGASLEPRIRKLSDAMSGADIAEEGKVEVEVKQTGILEWKQVVSERTEGPMTTPVSQDAPSQVLNVELSLPLGMKFNGSPEQGFQVLSTTEGGNAQQAGVAAGMRILQVNDISLDGLEKKEVTAVIKSSPPGLVRLTLQTTEA